MMKRKNIVNMTALRQRARIVAGRLLCFLSMFQCFNVSILSLTSCEREPLLHLYDARELEIQMPEVELELDVLWDYELSFDVHYDWKAEWYYDWDDVDREIFGELGYAEPTAFNLRRYYTGSEAYAPHTYVHAPPPIQGRYFRDRFDWGYWDLLAWNDIQTLDGVQSLVFDEETTLDSVMAYTNPSMQMSRYHAPRYNRSFYSPEPLFAAYEQAIDINPDLRGFVYNKERGIYVRTLNMLLQPITYIYLTQVILHHNKGRVTGVDGNANLSGMARSTTLNSGRAGDDAITVYYNCRMKKDLPLVPYDTPKDAPKRKIVEHADIIGGRLMTFGMCGQTPHKLTHHSQVTDQQRHYIDVTMQFYNGMDSTLVFDVTDQVRRRFKGGVLTVELDLDTVPIPQRRGGSGFDAVVKDFEDGGTWEFDM